MTPLIAVELICAVFIAVLTVRQFREQDASRSALWLKINSVLMFCWLLTDAGAYLTGLEYVLTLLAYTMGSVILFFSLAYFNAYIRGKTPLSPWVFRVPQVLALFCIAAAAVEFIAGRIVVYENGFPVAVNNLPVYFSVIQTGTLAFTVAVVFCKRKELGWKAVALFCLFCCSSVFGIVTFSFLGADYTVAFASVSLMIIVSFLQEHRTRVRMENAFASVAVLIIFFLLFQSSVFSKDPDIEIKPDNCYEKTLRVVTDEDYLPYSFYDSDGHESGHDVELMILLANEMEMNLDLKFVSWNEGIRMLSEGEADILLTCDYYDDFGGADGLLMTEPVSSDDFVVYSKSPVTHINQLYGKKIAVMDNANCLSYIQMYHLEDNIIYRPSNTETIRAVETGLADCAIVRYTVAEAILKSSGLKNVSAQITVGSSYTCFAVGGNDQALLVRLDKAIETMKMNGTMQKLEDKWLTTFVHTYSLQEIFAANPWLAAVTIAVAILGLLTFLISMRKRSRRETDNNARLFALEDNFISLYDVNLDSGEYSSYDRGEFYQRNIRNKLVTTNKFFENMRENVDRVVFEEDRDEVLAVQQKENMIRGLAKNDHIDHYYRLITENGPVWTKMRIVYKNAEKKNVIIGIFDASEEIAAREQGERLRTERMANTAGDVSSYIINPKTNRFLVFRQDEYLAGKYTPDEDFTSSFERYINTDVYGPDRKKVRQAMSLQALQALLQNGSEYRLAFRDISSGSPRWYELRAAKISEDDILVGFSDIDETYTDKMIFGKMKEAFFALVCVYLDTGMAHAVMDDPGHLGGAGNTVPYTEMIGRIMTMLSGDPRDYFEKIADIRELKEKFRKEDKAEYIYMSDFTGEAHWVVFTQLVLERDVHGDPAVVAFVFGFLDEETKKVQKLQLEVAEQQKQLEQALIAADSANRAKTDFLFNMSHDIRTPMNAIIGFTNMAKKEIGNPEKVLDSLSKVQVSSDILLNLINDVLDMSRIESGKVELHEEKYEFREAYDSFEPAMANLAVSKRIDLKFTIGEIRNPYIFTDGPRLDRILINIISNAIKYTPAEGFVHVRAEQIADTEPGYGNYRFTVTDNGIGMSEEFQKHMFENFSREENSTTRGIQGTGLGLALAKRLADLMGGTISCESTRGIGTTFTLVFPFRLQTEQDRAESAAEVQEFRELDLTGKRALLAEDNELNREIAVDILEEEGILVETAVDGQKAVNKLRERGIHYYDFILMDIQMPVMDGYEATRTIRRLMPELRAPIIALSANAFEEDKKKSLEAGMDDHVAKPINVKELMIALAKYM